MEKHIDQGIRGLDIVLDAGGQRKFGLEEYDEILVANRILKDNERIVPRLEEAKRLLDSDQEQSLAIIGEVSNTIKKITEKNGPMEKAALKVDGAVLGDDDKESVIGALRGTIGEDKIRRAYLELGDIVNSRGRGNGGRQ